MGIENKNIRNLFQYLKRNIRWLVKWITTVHYLSKQSDSKQQER